MQKKTNNFIFIRNYQQYYDLCEYFGIAMIYLGLTERDAVNILGFNSVEWMVSFHGSIFANMVPVGVYNTSSKESCKYIASHSEATVIIVDNLLQLVQIFNNNNYFQRKYMEIISELPKIRYIILMNDYLTSSFSLNNFSGKIMTFTELIQLGQRNYSQHYSELLKRMKCCQGGDCSHLVYTSGTTALPKAVMISHDNFTWNTKQMQTALRIEGSTEFVSFLPLSHVATQIVEVIGGLLFGAHVWFAEENDLVDGKLVEKWKIVRPTLIVGVPRVFEKIKDAVELIGQQHKNGIKGQLARWAKKQVIQGTFRQQTGQSNTLKFALAEKLVFEKVKKQLGLDRVHCIINGAAPLSPAIRKFFMELNILITICFGMTETAGGHIFTQLTKFDQVDEQCFASVGQCIEGAEVKIFNPDENGVGELCCKGRNIFMGYYKDREATMQVIDEQRFLHTQDLATIDKNGNITIVGRIKDLIITSGGENVAPQQLSDDIQQSLPQLISQVHIIGDQRKFITALITLKENNPEQSDNGELAQSALFLLNQHESLAKTTEEAIHDPKVLKLIEQAVQNGNKKGASQVAKVKKWNVIPKEFTVNGGELTSTMKIRRKIVEQKFAHIIEEMYNNDQQLSLKDSKL